MSTTLSSRILDARQLLNAVAEDTALHVALGHLATACENTLRVGGKILLAGNGGSAADAQHIAAELVGRYGFDRPGLAALALTTDTSILTAVANDYGYDKVFARQVQSLGRKGDVLIAYTTSGRSANILQALAVARESGLVTACLTGRKGGSALVGLCDHILSVPSDDTPRVQEVHLLLGHTLCEQLEQAIFR